MIMCTFYLFMVRLLMFLYLFSHPPWLEIDSDFNNWNEVVKGNSKLVVYKQGDDKEDDKKPSAK